MDDQVDHPEGIDPVIGRRFAGVQLGGVQFFAEGGDDLLFPRARRLEAPPRRRSPAFVGLVDALVQQTDHLVDQDLARRVAGKRIRRQGETDKRLVRGKLPVERDDLITHGPVGVRRAGGGNDDRIHRLAAVDLPAEDGDLGNQGRRPEMELQLLGVDVLPGVEDDDVLLAARDMNVALPVDVAQILGVEEALRVEDPAIGLVVPVVAGHHRLAPQPDLPDPVGAIPFDPDLVPGNRRSHGARACVPVVGDGDGAGGLGQAVALHDVEAHAPVGVEILLLERRAAADEEAHPPSEEVVDRLEDLPRKKAQSQGLQNRSRPEKEEKDAVLHLRLGADLAHHRVEEEFPHLGGGREDRDRVFRKRPDDVRALQGGLEDDGAPREQRGHEGRFEGVDVVEREHGQRHVFRGVFLQFRADQRDVKDVPVGERDDLRGSRRAGGEEQRSEVLFSQRNLRKFSAACGPFAVDVVNGHVPEEAAERPGDEDGARRHGPEHGPVLIGREVGVEREGNCTDRRDRHVGDAPFRRAGREDGDDFALCAPLPPEEEGEGLGPPPGFCEGDVPIPEKNAVPMAPADRSIRRTQIRIFHIRPYFSYRNDDFSNGLI
ncbi:MAG: hypothetical protein A4E73_00475 [Syntrophaceae bacterium PtaU1.Bin231]|nr:MAG: hypothetical protein A4E73_00475 [Syntrophaceae bacterium PtaU1.Bin231]